MDKHKDIKSVPNIGSERGFGLTFFVVFSLIGFWPSLNGENIHWWFVSIGVMLLVVSLVKPSLLSIPNKIWFKIGLYLGNIVAPLTMGLIFFFVVTPTGIIMKVLGKDPLKEKFDSKATTYWINKDLDINESDSMKNQF